MVELSVKVKVQIVRERPKLTRPDFAYGIASEGAAREWGERHGYGVVYWLKSKMRAYAEKDNLDQ